MIECKGVCIGADVGTARVGIVRRDPDGILTMSVGALIRQEDRSDIDCIGEIVGELLAIEVIVGLPRHSKGGKGVLAKAARRYAPRIKTLRLEICVAFVDKCLTSNQAYARLRTSGISEKDHRPIVNQVAAQTILEQVLGEERIPGRVPGKEITLEGGSAQ